MSFKLKPDQTRKYKALLKQYPDKRSLALPVLHMAQEQEGFLSIDTIKGVAELLQVPPAQMMDTVTFYSMFYLQPRGKYLLQVCQTLSCSLAGADQVVDHIAAKYHLKPGETSEDGRFTLAKVECLGSCGTAPVVQINDDYYEKMAVDKVDRVLDKLS